MDLDLDLITMTDNTKNIDFVWQGIDKNGNKTNGEINKKNMVIARIHLRQTGIKVIQIKKKPKPLFTVRTTPILSTDITAFFRQLATTLRAGVPLAQSLDIIGQGQKNPSMTRMILAIKKDIECGHALSEALQKRSNYFDSFFCGLVNIGEESGLLDSMMDKIATHKEKSDSNKAKIKRALMYPSAILIIASVVTAILLIFVVPVFENLFSNSGAELPAFTQFVVTLSTFAQSWWWVILGVLYIIYRVYIYIHSRSKKLQIFRDRMILKIPVVGAIINNSTLSIFARTLATTLTVGVDLVKALELTSNVCDNKVYRNAIMHLYDCVSVGQSLRESLEQTGLFPHMMIQMVEIGEVSGSIEYMLDKAADFYEEAGDNLIEQLGSLIEPVIMIILGVLIGGLIIAMYLPIFALGSAV